MMSVRLGWPGQMKKRVRHWRLCVGRLILVEGYRLESAGIDPLRLSAAPMFNACFPASVLVVIKCD